MRKNKDKRDLMLEAELSGETLNIPEEEIWTYRIDGLQAPRIVDKSVKTRTKAAIIAVLVFAIALSVFFSVYALINEEFDCKQITDGWEFVKYSNPGQVTEVNIDFAFGDKSKPITEIREYAFNCDEKIETINIGKDVRKIDGKSFYSCWNLENVFVDDDNPFYCDIDGVLYNKELTEIIYYPSAHNLYLTRQAGYKLDFPDDGSITNDDFCSAVELLDKCASEDKTPEELEGDNAALFKKFNTLTGNADWKTFIGDYNKKVGIYVLPSTVTEIGKLAFAYSDITEIYLPAGLRSIGTLGFFKAVKLREIYSYTCAAAVAGTDWNSVAALSSVCRSLPDTLESIGSDAFTYDRGITYMYIPSSVKEIGHHAFFNMAYKSGDKIEGLAKINVQPDESSFSAETKIGDSWLPKLDAGLFKKDVEVVYSSERETVR